MAHHPPTSEAWIIECVQTIRAALPSNALLTMAPQAPYFTNNGNYENGAMLTVHKAVGDLIDWYNIQFYNQGDSSYDTYDTLFVESNGFFTGSSVSEMVANGVEKEKIVVGKPVTQADAAVS